MADAGNRFGAFLDLAQEKLEAHARAIAAAIDHPSEVGAAREDALRDELRRLLPSAYSLTSGLVVIPGGHSTQQDILVFDSARYPAAPYGDGRHLLVPESVFASISVKSRIRPGELPKLFGEALKLKSQLTEILGEGWSGTTALFAYLFEGDWAGVEAAYFEMVADQPRRNRLDLLCVLNRPLLLDGHHFGLGNERVKGFGGLAGTARFFVPQQGGKHNDTYMIEPNASTFGAFYQLLLTRLSNTKLLPLRTMTLPQFIEVTKAEDVLAEQIHPPLGTTLPRDENMSTSCPTCGTRQRLSDATIRTEDDGTTYTCRNGCQPILVIGKTRTDPWPGRGYRLGEHVLRNPADLYVTLGGASNVVLLPASPAALMKQKPA